MGDLKFSLDTNICSAVEMFWIYGVSPGSFTEALLRGKMSADELKPLMHPMIRHDVDEYMRWKKYLPFCMVDDEYDNWKGKGAIMMNTETVARLRLLGCPITDAYLDLIPGLLSNKQGDKDG